MDDNQPSQQQPQQQPDQTQLSPWSQQVLGHMIDNLKSNHETPGVLAAQDRAYWSAAFPPRRRPQMPPQLNPDGSLVNEDGT